MQLPCIPPVPGNSGRRHYLKSARALTYRWYFGNDTRWIDSVRKTSFVLEISLRPPGLRRPQPGTLLKNFLKNSVFRSCGNTWPRDGSSKPGVCPHDHPTEPMIADSSSEPVRCNAHVTTSERKKLPLIQKRILSEVRKPSEPQQNRR